MKTRYLSLLALGLGTLLWTGKSLADNPLILNQFTADPTARLFEGKIYLYPSHDMPEAKAARGGAGWFAMEDYHVFSSENLLDWKDHGVILDQKQVPWVNGAANNMWAPDCVTRDGKYYFYFPASNRIGVAIADKPEGPFKLEPEAIVGGIDPCCFIDNASAKDGKKPDVYLVWAQGSIFIHKLTDDMKKLDPATQTLRVPNLPTQGQVEGPFLFERKGIYYLTYPHAVRTAGWESEQLEYMISDKPLGPYHIPPGVTPPATASAPATAPATAPARGGRGRGAGGPSPMGGIIMDQTANHCWTNHHSLVEYQGQWILFYHDRDLSPEFDKDRSVRADYVTFNDDGSIQKVIPTLRGVGIRDAKDNIQIDRYSAVSKEGTAVAFVDDTKRSLGWKITLNQKNAWVEYDRVDFGKGGLKTVNVRANSTTGGVLQIRLDKPDSPVIAEVKIEKGADWSMAHSALLSVPTGQHNLVTTLKDQGDVSVDWVSFE